MKTRMKRKSVGAEAESYLDLPRTRTWNLLMTTFGTEMIVFRSQVRYPITPADPADVIGEKQYNKNSYMYCFSTSRSTVFVNYHSLWSVQTNWARHRVQVS
jgi:hypothetical protein